MRQSEPKAHTCVGLGHLCCRHWLDRRASPFIIVVAAYEAATYDRTDGGADTGS